MDRKSVCLAGLAADDVGISDQRPPLVLLHGLTFSRRTWSPILEALERIDPGRRVVALDLPGHGESAAWPDYSIEGVADGVHRAVVEAGLDAPVVVGHSISAIIVTMYAARYPTRGVINVDQPLQPAPFARMLQSLSNEIRGPAFPAVWTRFLASMHVELLPAAAQELVHATSTPRQELFLAYQHDALHRAPEELTEWMTQALTGLRETRVPYLMVSGRELEPGYQRWLSEVLPQTVVATWPGSGHFPHLAHPDRFAERLAEAR